jgi:hypothetical protein
MRAKSRTIGIVVFLAAASFAIGAGTCIAAESLPVFGLGDATASPGETDLSIPLSIDLTPETGAIMAWRAALRYDPTVLGKVVVEDARGVPSFFFEGPTGCSTCLPDELTGIVDIPGLVNVTASYLDRGGHISWEDDGVVAHVRFCVLPSAPPGDHRIELVPEVGPLPNNLHYSTGYCPYPIEDGASYTPLMAAGTISVLDGPPAGEGCPRDPEPWVKAIYKLEGRNAYRGATVQLPFSITVHLRYMTGESDGVQGFGITLDFDEGVLEGVGIERLFERPDGEPWDFWRFEFNNEDAIPGSGGIEEGYFIGAGVLSFTSPVFVLPPDVENSVLGIRFRVRPEAPLGQTELRFLDGGPSWHNNNSVCIYSSAVVPEKYISPVTVIGKLTVLPDGTLFVRGDSNDDGAVDLSDAVASLSHLFLGGPAPVCRDAADVNDDGILDISDPIGLLFSLFLGSVPLPDPRNVPGEDPTPDALDCARS